MNYNSELTNEEARYPQLKSAISSLDLDLESEIARYLSHHNTSQSLTLSKVNNQEENESFFSISLQSTAVLAESLKIDLSEGKTNAPIPEEDQQEKSLSLIEYLLKPVTLISLLFFMIATGLLGATFLPKMVAKLINTEENKTGKLETSPDIAEQNPDKKSDTLELDEVSQISDKQANPVTKAATPTSEDTTTAKVPQSGDLATVLLPPSLREGMTPIAVKLSGNMNVNYYYVVSKYTGNDSLKKAKKIVKDAYLVNLNQGMGIILAAYARQEDALLFSQKLKNKGISSFVYSPKTESQNKYPH